MTLSVSLRRLRDGARSAAWAHVSVWKGRPGLLALVGIASFAVIALAYLLAPSEQTSRGVIAAVCATWAAGYATGCAALALRHASAGERGAWGWIAAACAALLAAQLSVDGRPQPSLASLGSVVAAVCFAFALRDLMPPQARRQEPHVALDAGLVTFTAVALGYVFLFTPLVRTPLMMSLVAAGGGVTMLWAVAHQMVRRRSLPVGVAGLVTIGIVLIGLAAVMRARLAGDGMWPAVGLWDVIRDAGLLLVAGAAAFAPERGLMPPGASGGLSGDAARLIAVFVAIAGIAALAITNALHPGMTAVTAPWVTVGIAIVGVRFAYALHADRRYAELLEREVAAQTRSLMDSLAATSAAERNLRLVMEAVPEAIFVLDREGLVIDMNASARAMKEPAGAGQRLHIFEFLDPVAAPTLRHHLDAAFQGEVRRFEVLSPRNDATRGVQAFLYAPIRDGWRVSRVLASVRDITDVKRTESQLQQAEKLAAVGQLVSGVAHEINNPAAIISGFAQTLLLDDLGPEQREMAQMIHDEATRIGRITQNLLAFARAGGKERTLLDLNDILRRTFALRSYHLSTLNIAVTLELDPTDPRIWANVSEMQQMLLNLMINAEQALVTVERPRTITIRSVSTEQEVLFEVADNGPGIKPDVRARVFDPFFTTKPEGVGTGLGLSICYGIAREHGGRVWVESEPGKGARFVIALPRDPRAETRSAPEPIALTGEPATRIRVLLLDDEAPLREAVLRYLARRDIDVVAVGDGGEALRALKQHDFDVILSDVRMPGMNGRDFVAHLRRERPELVARLIFSTGNAFAPDTEELLEGAGVPSVSKPFDFVALERLIRDIALHSKAR
jgi:signal transduction histidine kinase